MTTNVKLFGGKIFVTKIFPILKPRVPKDLKSWWPKSFDFETFNGSWVILILQITVYIYIYMLKN